MTNTWHLNCFSTGFLRLRPDSWLPQTRMVELQVPVAAAALNAVGAVSPWPVPVDRTDD